MTGDSNLHRKESAAIIIVGSCYLIHRGWSGKHKPKPPLGSPAPICLHNYLFYAVFTAATIFSPTTKIILKGNFSQLFCLCCMVNNHRWPNYWRSQSQNLPREGMPSHGNYSGTGNQTLDIIQRYPALICSVCSNMFCVFCVFCVQPDTPHHSKTSSSHMFCDKILWKSFLSSLFPAATNWLANPTRLAFFHKSQFPIVWTWRGKTMLWQSSPSEKRKRYRSGELCQSWVNPLARGIYQGNHWKHPQKHWN